jgi:hypothetical protein
MNPERKKIVTRKGAKDFKVPQIPLFRPSSKGDEERFFGAQDFVNRFSKNSR